MDNPSSPLDTLRQLKEMLDAGALTPTEFEALKQRLVFTEPPVTQVPPTAESAPEAPVTVTPEPVVPAAPVPPAAVVPPFVFPPAPLPGQHHPAAHDMPPKAGPSGGAAAPVGPPRAEEARRTEVPPTSPGPPLAAFDADAGWVTNEFPESAAPAARSPLALILSIGGLLALLALVVYLSMNRPPSERLSSTSQTAADSVAATIEVGPQAEPLVRTEAVPETIRVVPTNPAPVVPARPVAPLRDSVAAPAPAPKAAPAPTSSDSTQNP